MDVSSIAHMFEQLENCHKLSQLAPNSRSKILAAAIRRLLEVRSIPGKLPGRGALRGATGRVRSHRLSTRRAQPLIAPQNSNVSGVGSHGSLVACAERFHPTPGREWGSVPCAGG